jgi:propionyl-CoA carboxylase alpha chain
MFKKILIANRGEIACRIIRTARRMGIACVAVYSEADRREPFVAAADEAFCIGPPAAADSYLSIDAILAACHASGAEAVLPGYGFLSESAAFAEALEEAAITFIGPNRRALELMSDKIAARELALAAGVSILPGYSGAIADAAEAAKIAEAIAYPVLLKPVAGGGGKGMRIVRTQAEMESAFARAKSEAAAAFGDERIFIERFIAGARHIEIQILGDKLGNSIHLGERECSIQRRHQKIVEESPSPFVDATMRAEMASQALALAHAVDYDSAGTVEFLVDPARRQFYFIEMNTRLQVEHPVTECVSGIDLVEQMIRVAAGEALSINQADVTFNGWAIESRIYAEDPSSGFLPSSGRLVTFRLPQTSPPGTSLRCDMGVEEGSEVSTFYDPMIGKLITHASDRNAARLAQADALDQFVIEGVGNNLLFLAALMQHPQFIEGNLSTDFIEQYFPTGFSSSAPTLEERERLAAVTASIDHIERNRRRFAKRDVEFEAAETERCVLLDGQAVRVTVSVAQDGLRVTFAGSQHSLLCQSGWRPGQKLWAGRIDGEAVFVQVRSKPNRVLLQWRGIAVETCVLSPRQAELFALMPQKRVADRSRTLRAPMPALVKSVLVTVGQSVKAGEPLCVIEAMKMETVLTAEWDATVSVIHIDAGASVAFEASLMEFV